jgi:hypothetical protein
VGCGKVCFTDCPHHFFTLYFDPAGGFYANPHTIAPQIEDSNNDVVPEEDLLIDFACKYQHFATLSHRPIADP